MRKLTAPRVRMRRSRAWRSSVLLGALSIGPIGQVPSDDELATTWPGVRDEWIGGSSSARAGAARWPGGAMRAAWPPGSIPDLRARWEWLEAHGRLLECEAGDLATARHNAVERARQQARWEPGVGEAWLAWQAQRLTGLPAAENST